MEISNVSFGIQSGTAAKSQSFKAAKAKPEGKNTNYKKLAIAAAAITAAGIAALILIKKGKKPPVENITNTAAGAAQKVVPNGTADLAAASVKPFNYMDGINKINKDIADTAARTSKEGAAKRAADLAAAFGGEAAHVPQISSITAKAAPQPDSIIPMVTPQPEKKVLSFLPAAADVSNKTPNAGKKAANVRKKDVQKTMQAAAQKYAETEEKNRKNISLALEIANSTGTSKEDKLLELSKNLKEGQSLSDIADLSKAVQNKTGISKIAAVENLINAVKN